VTGESADSVRLAVRETYVPLLAGFRPKSFADVVQFAAALPESDDDGRTITAARAAVELALLDAYSRAFATALDEVPRLLGLEGFGRPGSLDAIRFAGVVSADDASAVRKSVFKMRLGGLRDFKVKVGDPGDDARLRAAMHGLGRALRNGRVTLRIDANGAWDLDTAIRQLAEWDALPVSCVEQPLPRDGDFATLSARTRFGLMADESLVTTADARALIDDGAMTWFNIRLAKNGGLIPALRMAAWARHAGVRLMLGCLVGETSILSAAGRWFLRLTPDVRFAEGSYGRFLLRGDVVDRPVQFGWGGRARAMTGLGLGISVEERLLRRYCGGKAEAIGI
jgi:muconate cycloisomerase